MIEVSAYKSPPSTSHDELIFFCFWVSHDIMVTTQSQELLFRIRIRKVYQKINLS